MTDKLTENDIVIDYFYTNPYDSDELVRYYCRVGHFNVGTNEERKAKAEQLKQQILQALEELPKLKEELQIWRERYSKLLNFKAISGKDEACDTAIVRRGLQDFIDLVNSYRGHYNKNPEYITTYGKARDIVDEELRKYNQKLKAELDSLGASYD